jgi:hypothetical protein
MLHPMLTVLVETLHEAEEGRDKLGTDGQQPRHLYTKEDGHRGLISTDFEAGCIELTRFVNDNAKSILE